MQKSQNILIKIVPGPKYSNFAAKKKLDKKTRDRKYLRIVTLSNASKFCFINKRQKFAFILSFTATVFFVR